MDDLSSHCSECDGPLAHDQRYCLRCGARRGPLPARIGLTIGEFHERGRSLPVSGAELSTPRTALPAPHSGDNLVPAARSAAVAILLMLAFGCVVGSLTTPGGVEALARQIVVAVSPAPVQPAVATANTGHSDTASSGNSGSAPASTPASTPAAAAAAPQQTVTIGSPDTPTSATTPSSATTPTNILGLPPVKHVWEIVLSQQGYNQAFAISKGHPYLSTQLRRQGELITDYYGVAQSPLANEIALISGQGPTPQTIAGCPTYADIAPATVGSYEQIKGDGCLYPQSAQTLPDQLAAAGLSWRAYIQGIGEHAPSQPSTTTTTSTLAPNPSPTPTTTTTPTTTPTTTTTPTPTTIPTPTTTSALTPSQAATPSDATPTTSTTTTSSTTAAGPPAVPPSQACPHPAFGGTDPYQSASVAAPYATWRNPFVYFRSVLIGGKCASSDVGVDRLATDLKQISTTPAFSYVSPGPCDDGSDTPCSANAPAGLALADQFLKTVVPEIEASPAYTKDGLIAITFDGAPQSGSYADPTSCCDQPAFPNLPKPPSTTSTSTSTSAMSTSTTASTSCTTSSSTTTASTATTISTTTTTGPTTPTTTSDCTPSITLPPGTNPGGGQVGLLLISPYVTPNSLDQVDTFNHFSLLKSIEDLFGLKPLGYARDTALPVFDAAIFKAAKP
jgi:phosphatidylinositol-3-phosphatase